MKVLVFGAGVVGSYYAAHLRAAGHQVTVLARGLRLAQIRQRGLVLEDALTQQRSVHHVLAVDQLRPDTAYDLILVAVGKQDLASVLPILASNWAWTNVLVLTNNAAGPGALADALGSRPVFWGFPGVGGVREGPLVRYVAQVGGRSFSTVLGERNGPSGDRLRWVAGVLESTGLPVSFCGQMDAWLKTHVALVLPLALGIYAAGGSVRRMAHTRDAIVLSLRGVREGFMVLETLQIPILPKRLRIVIRMPEPMLVALARTRLDTPFAELALEAHANAARGELKQLADEFGALRDRAGLATPALDSLLTFLDPKAPPLEEGRGSISLEWEPLLRLGAALFALLVGLGLASRRWRSQKPEAR